MKLYLSDSSTEVTYLHTEFGEITESIPLGKDYFDNQIVEYLKNKFNVEIGDATAERVNQELGSMTKENKIREIDVRGRTNNGGSPKSLVLNTEDIFLATQSAREQFLKFVLDNLNKSSNRSIIEISEASCSLRNIEKFLSIEMNSYVRLF
jgi:rod shape-determining protein MreB